MASREPLMAWRIYTFLFVILFAASSGRRTSRDVVNDAIWMRAGSNRTLSSWEWSSQFLKWSRPIQDVLKPNEDDDQCNAVHYNDFVLNDAYGCIEVEFRMGIFNFNVALRGQYSWRGFLDAENYKLVSLQIAGAAGIKLWPGAIHFEFNGELSIESISIEKHMDLIKYALVGLAKEKALRKKRAEMVGSIDEVVGNMMEQLSSIDPGYDIEKAKSNTEQPEFVGRVGMLFQLLRRSLALDLSKYRARVLGSLDAGEEQFFSFENAVVHRGTLKEKAWKKAQSTALKSWVMASMGACKYMKGVMKFKKKDVKKLKDKKLMQLVDRMLGELAAKHVGNIIENMANLIADTFYGSDKANLTCEGLSETRLTPLLECPGGSMDCYLELLGDNVSDYGPEATDDAKQILTHNRLAKSRPQMLCSVAAGLDGVVQDETIEDLARTLKGMGVSIHAAVLAMMPNGFWTFTSLLEATLSSMTKDYSNMEDFMTKRIENNKILVEHMRLTSELILNEAEEYLKYGTQARVEDNARIISTSSSIRSHLEEQIDEKPMVSSRGEEKRFSVEFSGEVKFAAHRVKAGVLWDADSTWNLCTTDRSDAQAGWVQSWSSLYALSCKGSGKCKASAIPETRARSRSLYVTFCPSFPGTDYFCYYYMRSKHVERSSTIVPWQQALNIRRNGVGLSAGTTHRIQLRLPFQGTAAELATLGTLLARLLPSAVKDLQGDELTAIGDGIEEDHKPSDAQQRHWQTSIVDTFKPLVGVLMKKVTSRGGTRFVTGLAGVFSSVLMFDIYLKSPRDGPRKFAATLTLRNDMSFGTGLLFQALQTLFGCGVHLHINDAIMLDLGGLTLLKSCPSAPEPTAEELFANSSTQVFTDGDDTVFIDDNDI